MTDHDQSRTRSLLDSVADETERLQAAIKTRTTTATSADGSMTVEVSADGEVHRWRVAGADEYTTRLVTDLLELVGQARNTAQLAIRTELDAVADRDDVRAATDAAWNALAQAGTAPTTTPTTVENSWDDDFDHSGARSRIAAD